MKAWRFYGFNDMRLDDIPELAGTLYVALGTSQKPHARITSIDFAAVRGAKDVVAVLTGWLNRGGFPARHGQLRACLIGCCAVTRCQRAMTRGGGAPAARPLERVQSRDRVVT